MITKELVGKTDDDIDVYKFTQVNKNGLVLETISYGAIIVAIKCPDKYVNVPFIHYSIVWVCYFVYRVHSNCERSAKISVKFVILKRDIVSHLSWQVRQCT